MGTHAFVTAFRPQNVNGSSVISANSAGIRVGRGNRAAAGIDVGLTDQTLSCAAKALVATAERHAACLHLKRAMQAA